MKILKISTNESNKLYVNGLHPDTTNQDLSNYFSTFGDITMITSVVRMIGSNNKSKGCGFIDFKDPISSIALNKDHIILNQKIKCEYVGSEDCEYKTYYECDNIYIQRKQKLKWIMNKQLINKLKVSKPMTYFDGCLNNSIFVLRIIRNRSKKLILIL